MRTLQLVNHLSDEQLRQHLSSSKGKPEFSRWQILYLVQVLPCWGLFFFISLVFKMIFSFGSFSNFDF